MRDEFIPPIKSRTTQELIEILGSPEKWNREVVRLANDELSHRNVHPTKIQTAQYLSKKRERIEKQKIANESYHICDFICADSNPIIEILLSWELKKDGYHRKAKQQKYLRIIILVLIIVLFVIGFS